MRGEEYETLWLQVSLSKNEEENYLLDKLIFRRISIFLTIILIKFRIRPNQATLLSLLSSLASLYFLTFNSRREMLIAAFLILLYYLLDHSTANWPATTSKRE